MLWILAASVLVNFLAIACLVGSRLRVRSLEDQLAQAEELARWRAKLARMRREARERGQRQCECDDDGNDDGSEWDEVYRDYGGEWG